LRLFESDSKLAAATWFSAPKDAAIVITEVSLFGEEGEEKTMFEFGERIRVRIGYRALKPVEEPHFLCSFKRSDQVLCCNFSSHFDNLYLPQVHGDGVIELLTPPLKLVSDRYTVLIAVRERGFQQLVAGQIGVSFHLRHETYVPTEYGVFHEEGQWRLEGDLTQRDRQQASRVDIGS
jgi:lipopolysaccharide transport system ATP-binding protein